MKLSVRLLAFVMLAPLAACATASVETAAVVPAEPEPSVQAEAPAEPPGPRPDTSLVGLYLAGNAAMREGQAEAAAAYFARAAELVEEEGAPFLKERAFLAAVNAGEISQAAALAPKDGEGTQATQRLAKLVLAVEAITKGDGPTASALLAEDVGQPWRSAGNLLRPWAAATAGQSDIVGQRTGSNDRLNMAFILANRALALEAAGQIAEAEAAYQGLMTSGVTMRTFLLSYGGFLERQGKKAEAVALYERMLAEQPEDRAALAARARASARRSAPPPMPTTQQAAAQAMLMAASGAINQGSADNALVLVRLALRLDPDRSEGLLLAAGFAERRKDYEEARQLYARVPESSPDYLEARMRIALAYRAENNMAKALEIAQETARLAPRDTQAQIDLADFLRATHDYEGAVKVLNRLISARGRDPDWRLHYARAISLENAGRWSEAEKDLLKALEISPNQPEVMNYLGYTWADRNERLAEALEMLQKAQRAQPNSGAIIDSLGWAYYRLGDIPKSIELLERAVELAPSDPEINDHLGDAYARAPGRRLEALFQWERVLTLQPDDELKTKVEAKIAAEQRATSLATAVEPAMP